MVECQNAENGLGNLCPQVWQEKVWEWVFFQIFVGTLVLWAMEIDSKIWVCPEMGV